MDKPDLPFLDDLFWEWFNDIRPAFFEHDRFKGHIADLTAYVERHCKNARNGVVVQRKVLAHCLHELEDQILAVIDEFLDARGWDIESLIFDGLMVVHQDNASLAQDLKDAEAEVKRRTGYDVALIEKPFYDATAAAVLDAALAAE